MLYDTSGHRKYLTLAERARFLSAAARTSPNVHTFCLVLATLGARLSEVLALTPERVDFEGGYIVIESLKKRRRGSFRAVPVPADTLTLLEQVHRISAARATNESAKRRIWNWSRTTAWARVKQVMAAADLTGSNAMPKALRHSFGVQATAGAGISLNMVRKWMGHARIETTAIYADAVGAEEKKLAEKIWPVN